MTASPRANTIRSALVSGIRTGYAVWSVSHSSDTPVAVLQRLRSRLTLAPTSVSLFRRLSRGAKGIGETRSGEKPAWGESRA